MKNFQYQILRFLPDRVSEEFINLGVVVYDPGNKKLNIKFIEKTGRLSQIFPEANNRYVLKTIKHICNSLNTIANRLSDEFEFEECDKISIITRSVFPTDDSALFFTEPKTILDIDINSVSIYLFDRLISIKELDNEKEYKNDKEVWSRIYKKYFDDLNISKYLTPVKLNTKFDQVEFEHTWRNGHINFFEPVNFNLEKVENIKNKVFRWAGQIDELKTVNEPSHLYLLSILPEDNLKIKKFIKEFLLSKSTDEVKVEIVTPENVDNVTRNLKVEFESHS